MTLEFLQRVSIVLVWVAIGSAVLAALATGARFYVERHEKRLSSERTAAENKLRDGELATAKRRLEDAEEARKQLEKEVAASRSELEAVRARTAPRKLTPEQRLRLIRELKSRRFEVAIASRLSDGEALDYANELEEVLRESGWGIVGYVNPTSLNIFKGLRVIRGPESNQPAFKKLIEGLRSAGIPFDAEPIGDSSIGSFRPGALYLVVGFKP